MMGNIFLNEGFQKCSIIIRPLPAHRPHDASAVRVLHTLQEAEVNIDCCDGEAIEAIDDCRRPCCSETCDRHFISF